MATKNFAANLKIGAVMSSTVGRVFGDVKAKLGDLGKEMSKLKRANAALGKWNAIDDKDSAKARKLAQELRRLGVDTDNAADEQKRLAAALNSTEKEIADLQRRLNARLNFSKSFKGVGTSFMGDTRRLAVGAAALAGAATVAGTAMASLTKGFVDWADDIGDSAEALGISTKALQTWQFAASDVGVDGAKMTASIAKFNKAVESSAEKSKEAAEGGKEHSDAFTKLGINIRNLKNLSLDKQLEVTAEAFSRYKGNVNKSVLAMEIFGKSGYQLAGVLTQGRDGLEEFRKEGEEMGAILTGEAAEKAGIAARALTRMGMATTGLRNKIAIGLAPSLGKLADKVAAFVSGNGDKFEQWGKDLGDWLENKAIPALEKFIQKLPSLIDEIGKVVTKISGWVTATKDAVGGWENLGMILVGLNFAPTIIAVGQLAVSMWTLSGATLATVGPWLLVGAAIGLLIAALIDLSSENSKIENWLNEKFPTAMKVFGVFCTNVGESFKLLWENMKSGFTIVFALLTGDFQKAGEEVEKVGVRFKEFFEKALINAETVIPGIRAAFAEFFGWIEGKWNSVGARIDEMWNKAKGIGNSIREFFGGTPQASTATAQIAPADQMPARDIRTSQTNKVDIHVQTAATDGRAFGQQLRQEIQRKPLFDMDGALVPA